MKQSTHPTLQFLGATGTVTGSRYLIEHHKQRVLIDCGLFQGYKQLRDRNRAEFPVPPETIDKIILTHAHLDHSGYLPALVRDGFRGEILCTAATRELCALLLQDSAHLMEEEARFAKKHGFSKHANPEPVYTHEDAQAAITLMRDRALDEVFSVGADISAQLLGAGHILGAAQVQLRLGKLRIHFSGDLGRTQDLLMPPPVPFAGADYLVCESTYGDRRHPKMSADAELAPVIRRVAARGGVIVIPAFAVGRAQSLLLQISKLRERGDIPAISVYLNSPMAVDATSIYQKHHDQHRITDTECREMYALANIVRDSEASKALNRQNGPMIIISASGMLTGGRVLHHIEAFGGDSRNAIVLSGFQAGGTRGAALAAGASYLRMFGRDVPIRAEIVQLESFSAHGDADEIMQWLAAAKQVPKMTFVTHGEPNASDALRARIIRELHWSARAPENLERVELV
jgi:metallo-beta-lactamase family protein